MIKNDLDKILGFYEPGVLHLRINTDENIFDLNSLISINPELFSTFLHEYIHFLQNITTTFGLFQTSFYINYIKDLNKTVLKLDSNLFETPVKLNDDFYSNTNLQLLNLYNGDNNPIDYIKYDYYIEEPIEFIDNEDNKFYPLKYKVFYYNKKGKSLNFHFGATCIKEYVAHAIQSDYQHNVSHPDVPYLVAELIVQKEYPAIGSSKRIMIALCDISLMAYDPARQFFAILKELKNSNYVPKNENDLIVFVKKQLKFVNKNGTTSQNELFEATQKQVISHLNDALKSKIFAKDLAWLIHILKNAYEIRIDDPNFMNKFIEEPTKLSLYFLDLFKKLGSPFYSNINFESGYVPPRDTVFASQPYMLLVFKQILNVYNGGLKCKLYDFCLKSNEEIVNNHCISAPWKRTKLDGKCPFIQFWITWGLENKSPYDKN